MNTLLLAATDLSGGYGDVVIARDISFTIGSGIICGLTGRNGAGKTTLVKLVSGALKPRSGTIMFQGEDMTCIAASKRLALGMSYSPQESLVFDTLTVHENLTLHHRDRSLERYTSLFQMFPRIDERLQQRAGTLSGGEKKILAFCRVMAENSAITILDEPTEGVQPENIDRMASVIALEKQLGRSFLIVDQNLLFLEQVADQILLMDHGNIVHSVVSGQNTRKELQKLMMV